VLEGLRGDESIAPADHRDTVNYVAEKASANRCITSPLKGMIWSKEFMEAGKQRLAGNTKRQADSSEVKELRKQNDQLKELVAELALKNKVLKKSLLGWEDLTGS